MSASTYDLIVAARGLVTDGLACEDDAGIDAWQADVQAWAEATSDKYAALHAVQNAAEAEAVYLTVEADKLRARALRATRTAEKVKGLALDLLLANEALTGQERVRTSDGSYAAIRRRETVAVQVDNPMLLPVQYLRLKEPEPNKVAIKAAIQAGEQVPGATLVTNESVTLAWGK